MRNEDSRENRLWCRGRRRRLEWAWGRRLLRRHLWTWSGRRGCSRRAPSRRRPAAGWPLRRLCGWRPTGLDGGSLEAPLLREWLLLLPLPSLLEEAPHKALFPLPLRMLSFTLFRRIERRMNKDRKYGPKL